MAAGLLLGLGKPEADEPSIESEDDADPELMAAGDMIDALKSGDKMALKDAFKRMYDACSMGGETDDELDY